MMHRMTLLLAAASLVQPAAAQAQDRTVLEASSPWNINYADDFCRLQRAFGTGDDKVVLMIDRFAPSEDFRMNLVGKRFWRGGPGTATAQFGPDLPEQKLKFYVGDLADKIPAWVFISAVRIRPLAEPEEASGDKPVTFSEAEEASVTQVQIGKPLKAPLILRTGSMKGAFAALRACTDELLQHWGIDLERHRQAVTMSKPLGSPGRWLRNSDYPGEMMIKGQPGLVQFRLVVGEDGAVASCHIQQSTNPKGFNDAVCNALKRRAQFEPARDKDGQPIKSYYVNRVHFQSALIP